ncbi:MAG: glycosyltransferase family 4 protein [Patescibacteria group bacterium]
MTRILYAGRVAPIKDLPTLEKAVKILNLKLIVNSSYSYHDVAKILKSADIVVVPTLSRALDKVFLEALACGVPAIGTDIGYPFMVDKFPQLIFKAGNPEDLAQKIKWLIDNPKESFKITKEAKKYIKENFDLGKLMDRIVNLCR